MEKGKNKQSRRKFFLKSATAALGTMGGVGLLAQSCQQNETQGEKVSLLSPDGTLVQVDKSAMSVATPVSVAEARNGIPNKKFVMVIDLARCRNARKCVTKCQSMHALPPEDEWIKVFLMQDSSDTAPYWFLSPAFIVINHHV